ncbi:reverse transcriptase/maturase family protein [Exiguobacterium antarcticum]|uniref:Reverse transcriptase/maturase family protein n=1 Tax=Exiguobacterium antarcticum TaxID=132920 RepID=A0ABT6QZY6_9BACL|nr:reverse transcriptase/maturase family protein [Exiguobacterium antarcticum]MDI3234160.1 reverse transcriptase/maturase family protein [Exiguobacterium antarcticum]
MKRIGNLYEQIIDYEQLYIAYRQSIKNKRFKPEILRFSQNLEENLIQIQNELIHGTYQVSPYRQFYVHEPKKRLIMSLPFRDRVVQWSIYQTLMPLYERTFIHDSYACRKGKGAHRAVRRLQSWIRTYGEGGGYCLKIDVAKYFYRVDHQVLLAIIERKIKDKRLINLVYTIVSCEQEEFGIELGDHHYEKPRVYGIGMPIGNLLSQLCANIYLNELDQFVKHTLRLKHYMRYMDDMVVLHHSKKELREALFEIECFLQDELRLSLNNKTSIRPIQHGVDWVGYQVHRTHIRMRKSTSLRMKRRVRHLVKKYQRGEVDNETIHHTVQSYNGLMKHGNCHALRTKLQRDIAMAQANK